MSVKNGKCDNCGEEYMSAGVPFDGLCDQCRELTILRERLAKAETQIEAMKCCGNCNNNRIETDRKIVCYPCRRFVMDDYDAQYDNWQFMEALHE